MVRDHLPYFQPRALCQKAKTKFTLVLLILCEEKKLGEDMQIRSHEKPQRKMECKVGRRQDPPNTCFLEAVRGAQSPQGQKPLSAAAGVDQGSILLCQSGEKCPGCCLTSYEQTTVGRPRRAPEETQEQRKTEQP